MFGTMCDPSSSDADKTMVSTIQRSDSFNWIIGPASHCVLLVGEETVLAGFLQRAIAAAANQEWLLGLAREKMKGLNNPDGLAAIDRIIAEQSFIAQQAKELINQDFHPINVHGLIGLWVAVEVAVEDTAVLVLTKTTQIAQEAISLLKNRPKIESGFVSEASARRIFDRLQRQFREGRSVSDAYQQVLHALKINVSVSSESAKVLAELNYVRNCLLHRGGVVDERAAVEAPFLGLAAGDSVHINGARYLQYFEAVSEFARALLKGVMESPYVRLEK